MPVVPLVPPVRGRRGALGAGAGALEAAALGAGLLDLAAPGARLGAPLLHHLLEAVEVALDAVLEDAELVAHLLHDALGLRVELEHDPRGVVVEPVERHHAGVLGARPSPSRRCAGRASAR